MLHSGKLVKKRVILPISTARILNRIVLLNFHLLNCFSFEKMRRIMCRHCWFYLVKILNNECLTTNYSSKLNLDMQMQCHNLKLLLNITFWLDYFLQKVFAKSYTKLWEDRDTAVYLSICPHTVF